LNGKGKRKAGISFTHRPDPSKLGQTTTILMPEPDATVFADGLGNFLAAIEDARKAGRKLGVQVKVELDGSRAADKDRVAYKNPMTT
jgi:hypothetical protein